jgi:hypothetical protein
MHGLLLAVSGEQKACVNMMDAPEQLHHAGVMSPQARAPVQGKVAGFSDVSGSAEEELDSTIEMLAAKYCQQ